MTSQADRIAALEQENQGLREELDMLRAARLDHIEQSTKPAPVAPAP